VFWPLILRTSSRASCHFLSRTVSCPRSLEVQGGRYGCDVSIPNTWKAQNPAMALNQMLLSPQWKGSTRSHPAGRSVHSDLPQIYVYFMALTIPPHTGGWFVCGSVTGTLGDLLRSSICRADPIVPLMVLNRPGRLGNTIAQSVHAN